MTNRGIAFPVEDPRSAAEKHARYERVVDDRLPDPLYHYAVTLPRDWEPSRFPTFAPTEDTPIGCLGLYRPASGGPWLVEVTARLLNREMAPAEWLISYLAAHDHKLLHSRRWHTPGGDVMDALSEGPSPDGQHVVSRWLALKDSDDLFAGRIVMAEARASAGRYPELALDLLWGSNSLEILHPTEWPFAERLRSYSAGRPGDFVFLYPYSWELNEARADETLTGTRLVEIDNVIDGTRAARITIVCSGSATQPRDLVEPFLRGLASRALIPRVGELMEAPPFGGLSRAWAAFGSAHVRLDPQGQPLPPQSWPFDAARDAFTRREPAYDLQLRVGQRENAWYLFALVGVPRAKVQPVAAINERAYALVLETMKSERAR